MPFFFEAAILSRMRSAVTSRSNWAKDRSTFSVTLGYSLLGAEEVARFSMAISGFAGLQYTFTAGGHIRMTLVLQRLSGLPLHLLELFCAIVLVLVLAWASYYWFRLAMESWQYGDMAGGVVALPAAYIQIPMGIGLLALLFSALLHTASIALMGSRHLIEKTDEIEYD